MKNLNLKAIMATSAIAVLAVPALATDPTFGDVTTAAQSGTLSFLSTNAAALFGILLLSVGFKMAWKIVKGIGRG